MESAFAAWTVTDPATGLPGTFSFVADFLTPVAGPAPTVNVNAAGAEIDLLTETDAVFWDPGDPNRRAETFFDTAAFGSVTLTSGTPELSWVRDQRRRHQDQQQPSGGLQPGILPAPAYP